MKSGAVVIDELDRQGRLLDLTRDVAAALEITGLVEVRPDVGGRWRILSNGKVGAVRIGDLQVQVTPKEKVGLTRLLFLLGYAINPGFRPEDVVGSADDDLWPALAESLARMAERSTARGVIQGYRTVEESLRTVRGRIRIGDQISRRPGQMVPIEVTYDEFTVDIAENQILRAAIRRMLAVPRLSADVRARLGHLDGRLAEVTVLGPRELLPSWRATRLNEHYAPALRLSALILENASAEAGDGDVRVASFVVDMAKVFEDFVGTAITEALRRFPGSTRLQFPTQLDETEPGQRSGIPMKVDIVHLVDRRPRIVLDAKYKAAAPGDRYPNADHYQMLAYCTALAVPTAWLVYAGGSEPRRRRIRNTAIDIIEYPLDLSSAPKDLLSQVDLLALRAWRFGIRQFNIAS